MYPSVSLLCSLILASSLSSCDGHIDTGSGDWKARTGEFTWSCGTVTLPPGWAYREWSTGDSASGSFSSGERWIGFDFGPYAGHYAGPHNWRFEEKIVRGARVWIGQRYPDDHSAGRNLFAVEFPDCGEANFFMPTNDKDDWEPMLFIANSFRPRVRAAQPQ